MVFYTICPPRYVDEYVADETVMAIDPGIGHLLRSQGVVLALLLASKNSPQSRMEFYVLSD